MGENNYSGFKVLGRASKEQLFHLQNGLDFSSVRELSVELKHMSDEVFRHHVNRQKNDFAIWIRDVFGDKELANKIKSTTSKNKIAKLIGERIIELEEKELKRFGVNIPSSKLKPIENYIEQQLQRNVNPKEIKEKLTKQGWNEKIIDLIMEAKDNPYKEFSSIKDIKNIESFHKKIEQLKITIINSIAEGHSIDDIKKMLRRMEWHEDIIDFIFFDIYKPHPNIKKLSSYIIHQIKDKNKDIKEVKETLQKLGWKDYLIEGVIYGINQPTNNLEKILSYLHSFSPEEETHVKHFLLKMGWHEETVNEVLRKRELEDVSKKLKYYNLSVGKELKKNAEAISRTIIKVKNNDKTKKLWKELLTDYKKISRKELKEENNELHYHLNSEYYYAKEDLEKIEELEGETITDVYYNDDKKPVLINLKHKYLIIPQIIKRRCIVTKKLLPVNKMKKIEMWDQTRTHKIIKYVSIEHEKFVKNFLEDTIIQH